MAWSWQHFYLNFRLKFWAFGQVDQHLHRIGQRVVFAAKETITMSLVRTIRTLANSLSHWSPSPERG
jgi:hypothetical protein